MASAHGSGAPLGDLAAESLLVAKEEVDLLAWPEVLLGSDPDRPDAVLPVSLQLGRTGSDASITGHHDHVARTDDGHPVQVEGAQRNLRQVLVAG